MTTTANESSHPSGVGGTGQARGGLLFSIVAALGIALIVVLFLFGLPAYTNKYSCMAQLRFGNHTGIWLHRFPEDFTGIFRLWDEKGRLTLEHPYDKGMRTGNWREYGTNGNVVSSCVYSNNLPWEGFCHPIENKYWMGEYHAGKPWNGMLPVTNSKGETEWLYFIAGLEFTKTEYQLHYHVSTNSTVIGIQLRHTPW